MSKLHVNAKTEPWHIAIRKISPLRRSSSGWYAAPDMMMDVFRHFFLVYTLKVVKHICRNAIGWTCVWMFWSSRSIVQDCGFAFFGLTWLAPWNLIQHCTVAVQRRGKHFDRDREWLWILPRGFLWALLFSCTASLPHCNYYCTIAYIPTLTFTKCFLPTSQQAYSTKLCCVQGSRRRPSLSSQWRT